MNTFLTIYHRLKTIITQIFSVLKLNEREHPKGRKPTLSNIDTVTCAILKQKQNIATKKSLWELLEPPLSYQKFVDALNRIAPYLTRIIVALLSYARKNPHLVEFTDAIDIPVCFPKNGKHHRTMKGLAAWSQTGKGSFFGLKLHLSADLEGRVLAVRFTPGNSDDRAIFKSQFWTFEH